MSPSPKRQSGWSNGRGGLSVRTGLDGGQRPGGSNPAPGFFFDRSQFPLIGEQIAALRGNLSAPGTAPGDLRYIQSVRAIGLSPGAETDLWVVVLAGQGDAAFARAADAATEDIRARRRRLADALAAEPPAESEWSYTAPATVQAVQKPACGRNCMLRLIGKRAPAGSPLPAALQHLRRPRE